MKNIRFQFTFYMLYILLDQRGLNEPSWLDQTLKILLLLTKMNFSFKLKFTR